MKAVALLLAVCLATGERAQSQAGQARHVVTPGITVLLRDSSHLVRGKRVGLITNHTGRDERGRNSIDLLFNAPEVRLVALFAPEHGIRGSAEGGALISSSVDKSTGVRIHSLYGETKVPTARMLADLDVLIYDIQDVGARMYTYVWTMTLAAEAAKKAGKTFIVTDRPNPIRSDIIEGGLIEARYRSFTGLHNVPVRYGLTPGELVRYLAGTGQIDAAVTVIPMQGYAPSMWWADTGFPWIKPSPNIVDADAALLYPGVSFFEGTNISEGRGTTEQFRLVGARWMTTAPAIARTMNSRKLGGVRFESVTRTIARGQKQAGTAVPMVRIIITNRDSVRSTEIGAHLLKEIYSRHPTAVRFQPRGLEELSGSRALRTAVTGGGAIDPLLAQWRRAAAGFERDSRSWRLY
ncbi:MAG: exo-beta-N-acetylmuramidase NamZ family protein [Gemmatimonadaceae bacterium]